MHLALSTSIDNRDTFLFLFVEPYHETQTIMDNYDPDDSSGSNTTPIDINIKIRLQHRKFEINDLYLKAICIRSETFIHQGEAKPPEQLLKLLPDPPSHKLTSYQRIAVKCVIEHYLKRANQRYLIARRKKHLGIDRKGNRSNNKKNVDQSRLNAKQKVR